MFTLTKRPWPLTLATWDGVVAWLIFQQTNVKARLRSGIQVELSILERQVSCNRAFKRIAKLVNNEFTAALAPIVIRLRGVAMREP